MNLTTLSRRDGHSCRERKPAEERGTNETRSDGTPDHIGGSIVQYNRLTRPLTRFVLVLLLLLGAAGSATARPNQPLLRSEESFREQLGERAIPIAKGVYQVEIPSGEKIRVAFGRDGMKHEIEWLRSEISALRRSNDPSAASRLRVLSRALAKLAPRLPKKLITSPVSEDGTLCPGYFYHLDGSHTPGLVGGTTWGEASVAPDGFSPPPPAYPCAAYSFVITSDGYGNYPWDERYDQNLGAAWAAATVDCGYASWYCPTWESYNWVLNEGCADGFRSIYRYGTNP